MRFRLGIGGKLLLAFGGISMLTVASALVGWYAFDRASRVQDLVVSETVPFLSKALSLAEISHDIITSSPALTEALSEARRVEEATGLFRQAEKLQTLLQGLAPAGGSDDAMSPLQQSTRRIVGNLKKQNELVRDRISLLTRFSGKADAARASVTQIVDLSGALVSNAVTTTTATVANLYEMVDTVRDPAQIFPTLDRLIEVEVDTLERMFELRHRSAVLGLLVGQLERSIHRGEIGRLKSSYARHLRIIERRVKNVADPYRKGQAEAALRNLRLNGQKPGSLTIFDLRDQVLQANARIAGLAQQNRILSESLQAQVDALVSRSRRAMQQAVAESDQALRTGNITLLVIAILSLAIAMLIAWFYVRRKVAHRIIALSGVTGELARGNLEVTVHDDGNDELSDMAGVLKVFKANALAKQRLEQEQKQTESELRRHKFHLEQLVSERTDQLEKANERLSEEVDSHAEARKLAEQASRAKSAFLAAMSHEIRTPITGILGTLHLLDEDRFTPGQKRRLGIIRASGETLLSIINDILDYSKIEAGHLDIVRTDFDIAALIEDLADLLEVNARDRGLALDVDIAPGLPRALKGDPGHIRQILINLIGNAIKFTNEGGVTVRALSGSEDGRIQLRIEVIDTGIGIAEEDKPHLFDVFYQADAPAAGRKTGGTGLGLAICARLVRAMGGAIGVESREGEGSTFWMELPLEPGNGEAGAAAGGEAKPLQQALPSLRVLLVEDNPVNCEIAQSFLEGDGHSVQAAGDGETALALLARGTFDLVLMDISLPGMNGQEAARQIRAMEDAGKRTLPVIAMSAHVFREEVSDYLAAGMNAFLGKPYTPQQLRDVIHEVMGGNGASPVITNAADTPHEDGRLINPDILREDWNILGPERGKQMVGLFLTNARQLLADVQDAVAQDNWDTAEKAAHSLKSAAGSLGLTRLFTHAKQLEDAAASRNAAPTEKLVQALPELIASSSKALQTLAEELEQG